MLVLAAALCAVWALGSGLLVGLCRAAARGDAVLRRLDPSRHADSHEYALPA